MGLVPERRPSTEGKTYGVYEIHDEELVTETGERLILEEEPTVMKMEPEVDAEVETLVNLSFTKMQHLTMMVLQ